MLQLDHLIQSVRDSVGTGYRFVFTLAAEVGSKSELVLSNSNAARDRCNGYHNAFWHLLFKFDSYCIASSEGTVEVRKNEFFDFALFFQPLS